MNPTTGEVYMMPGAGDCATRWAVVKTDDRHQTVFAVPVDGFPLYGLSDQPLREGITARCGWGLWLPRDAFVNRISALSKQSADLIASKLHEVVTANIDGTEAARESEANPDYHEWMGEVGDAVAKIADLFRRTESQVQIIHKPGCPSPWMCNCYPVNVDDADESQR